MKKPVASKEKGNLNIEPAKAFSGSELDVKRWKLVKEKVEGAGELPVNKA